MTLTYNIFDAIYPAVLRRFKIESEIIENIYFKSFDEKAHKNISDLDNLIGKLITQEIDTNTLTLEDLNELIKMTGYEYRLSNRFNDFLSYFTITSLYSSYEKYLRDIVLLPTKMDNLEYKRMSYFSNLKKYMKNKLGIDYNELPYNKEIENLRCLNNCIKHDRVVGKDLNVLDPVKWPVGKEIANVTEEFMRLKEVPYLILEFLTIEVKRIVENKTESEK